MLSVLEILQKTTEFFVQKGVENARFNAEVLVGHSLGLKRMQLYLQFERLLSEAELEKIRPLVRRRAQREPLAYVLGETEFHGLKLKTDRRALIPRPETEELVELVIKRVAGGLAPTRILDLGTGSGCIALALAKALPEAQVTALDASEDALALAAENAANIGISEHLLFLKSDWFSSLKSEERFELIVANPPYLTSVETQEAQPEVKSFEPHSALTSAEEGMADLRKIIAGAAAFMCPGALLAMETGIAQHTKLLELMSVAGFVSGESLKDLSGRDRFVCCRAPL